MVAIADVARAMALTNEVENLSRAISNLNSNGRIISMRIGPDPANPDNDVPVTIRTVGWEYPPEMVAAIRDKCQARRDELDKELEGLGVTGVEGR